MDKYITKAALKYDGKIYTGFDHGKCFAKLDRDNHIIVNNRIEEGFITSDGDFVDRKEAMKIAEEADQLQYSIEHYDKKTLISEDLHIDWLTRQAEEIDELKINLDATTDERHFYANLVETRDAEIRQLKNLLEIEKTNNEARKQKLHKTIRERKRLKSKLDILYTDYCLLQDTLENANEWNGDYKRRLKNAYKKINRLVEELKNAKKAWRK